MKAPLGVVVAMLLAGRAEPVAAQAHTRVKTPAAPGEQAPPADPGQNNFGAPIMRPGPGGQRPPAPPRRPKPKFGTVSLDEISMSDPFVHPDAKTRTYYLIGSGGHLYKSPDLKAWTGPYSVIDLEGRPRHAVPDVRRDAALRRPPRGREGTPQAPDLDCR